VEAFVKKLFYHGMYEATNFIMLLWPHNENHFRSWWEASEYYRRKRDAA
jgi:hypothetical protein